jgi:hypothetical protein
MLLNALLSDEGIPLDKTLLLRHADRNKPRPPYWLWQNDRAAFERYQSMQLPARVDQLSRVRYWVVFAANEMAETVFLGVYEASSPEENQTPVPLEVQPGMVPALSHYIFRTQPLPYLSWLAGSMKIDWGNGAINWVQAPLKNPKTITTLDGVKPVGIAQERAAHQSSIQALAPSLVSRQRYPTGMRRSVHR